MNTTRNFLRRFQQSQTSFLGLARHNALPQCRLWARQAPRRSASGATGPGRKTAESEIEQVRAHYKQKNRTTA